jgi:peptidyl-prolyl cis-trans isomerase C
MGAFVAAAAGKSGYRRRFSRLGTLAMVMRLPYLAAASLALGLLFAATPLSAQTTAADDPIVARVNGHELHRSDVTQAQRSLPEQWQRRPLPEIYPMLLDQLVSGMLIAEAGRQDKLADDPEVKRRIATLEDRVIQEAYITRAVEAATTDARLHEQYDQFVKAQPANEEVSARHILVATEDEAKAIIVDLGKGADFATIAKEKSTDPAKDNGGDLGFFTRDSMVPEFAEAAFNLGKGEYTKTPVHTQFGWHVILVEDRRAVAPPSFEDSKAELSKEVAHEVIIAKVKALKDGAKVETFALDGSPMPAKP